MRIASVVLALATGVVASAQSAAPVVELRGSLSNPTPTTGEIVRVDVTLTNQGPPSIRSIWTDLDVTGGLVVAVRCGEGGSSSPFQNPSRCSYSSLSQGQKVDYSFDVQVGNSASALSIEGRVVTYTYRSTTASPPTVSIQVPVTDAGTVADLGVDAREEPSPIPVGTAITYETSITNHGPDDATDVFFLAHDPTGGALSGVTGASCEVVRQFVACRVGPVSAGTSATIRYNRMGRLFPVQYPRTISVMASSSFDPVASNSSLTRQVVIGLPAELTRVLLPLVVPPTNGAFGSRWISEVSMYVDADEPLFVFPTVIECPILCDIPPLQGDYATPRRLSYPRLWTSSAYPGQLLRFDRSRSREVSFSARIRDTSRELETWGTAIPVVTDDDLVRGRLQLIDVAAGPSFRQTLRIYEPDATEASIRVRIWGHAVPETLLGERVLVLSTPPGNIQPERNAGLPFIPGYVRVDLATVFPEVEQYPRLRIELEAASGETRYWAFVSITNNETQHVTLVVPGTRERN